MKNKYLDEEEEKVYKQIAEKQKEENELQRKVFFLFPSFIQQSEKRSHESITGSKWDSETTTSTSKWDAPTPCNDFSSFSYLLARDSLTDTPARSSWDETPSRSKWDQQGKTIGDTPGAKRSRWDETPVARAFGSGGVTPILSGSETPLSSGNMWQQEMAWRNRPLSDEELDSLLPGGYRIVTPPENYV